MLVVNHFCLRPPEISFSRPAVMESEELWDGDGDLRVHPF